ncbi:MAG: single-stranded DNA-binding protein [Candidatus Pacebacteria bacterium]|nr:single-stranded DNA-binding protein [Candidatus Paceibacterota bacterium]
MYINKAMLFGNLTRDPELKALPSGTQVTNFSIATNRVWKDKDGNNQNSTDFHNIVVFGRQAETVAQYLKKGSSAYVEGRIQTRSWDADDGSKRYRTEVVADRVQFGPKTGGSGSAASAGSEKDASGNDGDQIDYPEEEINPEDIPF